MRFLKRVECFSFEKLLDDSTNFADKHIRLIQNSLYVCFGVGVLVLGRQLHLVKQFHHVSEIPDAYIRKQVSLRGHVVKVSHGGSLHVQHIPVIRIPLVQKQLQPLSKDNLENTIPVKLIGIHLSESHRREAVSMLETLENQTVWFKLIHSEVLSVKLEKETKNSTCLHCLVSKYGRFFSPCINYQLLRFGFAQVQPLPENLVERKLTNKLFKAQKRAVYWKRGIWK